jgi:hypothetical protein
LGTCHHLWKVSIEFKIIFLLGLLEYIYFRLDLFFMKARILFSSTWAEPFSACSFLERLLYSPSIVSSFNYSFYYCNYNFPENDRIYVWFIIQIGYLYGVVAVLSTLKSYFLYYPTIYDIIIWFSLKFIITQS